MNKNDLNKKNLNKKNLNKIAKQINITIEYDTDDNYHENYINALTKLMKDQRCDNQIRLNENIIEISKMKNKFINFT